MVNQHASIYCPDSDLEHRWPTLLGTTVASHCTSWMKEVMNIYRKIDVEVSHLFRRNNKLIHYVIRN
jgi:hypothetical protein